MFQSNANLDRAFFALFNNLIHATELWKLRTNRLEYSQKIIDQVRMKEKKNGLENGSVFLKIEPCTFPVWMSIDEKNYGICRLLPFFYLSFVYPSSHYYVVELIELPLIHSDLFTISGELIEIENILGNKSQVFLSYRAQSGEFEQTVPLQRVREQFVYKISKSIQNDATITFSCLSQESLNDLGFLDSGYKKALSLSSLDKGWKFHAKRFFPFVRDQKFCFFNFESWSLNFFED